MTETFFRRSEFTPNVKLSGESVSTRFSMHVFESAGEIQATFVAKENPALVSGIAAAGRAIVNVFLGPSGKKFIINAKYVVTTPLADMLFKSL